MCIKMKRNVLFYNYRLSKCTLMASAAFDTKTFCRDGFFFIFLICFQNKQEFFIKINHFYFFSAQFENCFDAMCNERWNEENKRNMPIEQRNFNIILMFRYISLLRTHNFLIFFFAAVYVHTSHKIDLPITFILLFNNRQFSFKINHNRDRIHGKLR